MADRKQQQQETGVEPEREKTPRPHHVADEPVAEADSLGATVQSPTTRTGLPVEEQVRKEWDPKKDGGLPTSHRPPK
jgi:hypothetical protein